jgi:hypothetical protein
VRIFGDLLLALGIIFLILFVLAEFGGGGVGAVPFIISGVLIVTGANLRSAGGGILRKKPEATTAANANKAAAAAQSAATPAPEFSTVELPMTPDVTAAIAAQNSRNWRNVKYVNIFFFAFFLVLGIVLDLTVNDVTPRHIFLAIFPLIGLVSAIMIGGISWLSVQRPARHDLSSATYLRTTGPLGLVYIYGGAILRLADRSFIVNGKEGIPALSSISWGTVDYSPHGHMILSAWNSKGKSVYCLPGYKLGGQASRI